MLWQRVLRRRQVRVKVLQLYAVVCCLCEADVTEDAPTSRFPSYGAYGRACVYVSCGVPAGRDGLRRPECACYEQCCEQWPERDVGRPATRRGDVSLSRHGRGRSVESSQRATWDWWEGEGEGEGRERAPPYHPTIRGMPRLTERVSLCCRKPTAATVRHPRQK